jgi:hypothetical protein
MNTMKPGTVGLQGRGWMPSLVKIGQRRLIATPGKNCRSIHFIFSSRIYSLIVVVVEFFFSVLKLEGCWLLQVEHE